MTPNAALHAPPFCPNPACNFHAPSPLWPCVRAGYYSRLCPPQRIPRFRCRACGRHFSTQTFSCTYWLKRPELLGPVFHGLVAGSAFRQLGRSLGASPQTIALLSARLGRHCLLYHLHHRPLGPVAEPLVLDSFQSFEYSHYAPTLFHLLAGQDSHFVHGFTDSELRRSGAMRAGQKRRRAALEARFGRPDPRSTRREVTRLLEIALPEPQALVLHSDEHQDYPRALAALPHLEVTHRTISSRAARTTRNPLFALNLLDLLLRHSGANHRRETIAFSKRRQSAAERLWVTVVWRNHMKWFSERRHEWTPAMRAGVATARLTLRTLLKRRLFVSQAALPAAWAAYYWRTVRTRYLPHCREHRRVYAT